jgi:hypothetical protein
MSYTLAGLMIGRASERLVFAKNQPEPVRLVCPSKVEGIFL